MSKTESVFGGAFDPVSAIDAKVADEMHASNNPLETIRRKSRENKRRNRSTMSLEEQTAADQIEMLNGMVERGELKWHRRTNK